MAPKFQASCRREEVSVQLQAVSRDPWEENTPADLFEDLRNSPVQQPASGVHNIVSRLHGTASAHLPRTAAWGSPACREGSSAVRDRKGRRTVAWQRGPVVFVTSDSLG